VSIVVFLGPTLELDAARAILPAAVYARPAAAGDVFNAVENQAEAVVLIDGLFDQVPSVWHKEILYALSRGIPVYGASSLGALRAAELHSFGMIGVGRIFEAFRDGVLEDDDEVAVVHRAAEDGFACLSEAMVNLRDGLVGAAAAGVIRDVTRDRLEAAAKARFYAARSWDGVYADAATLGIAADEVAALRAFVQRERPNLKRDDGVRVLELVAAMGTARRHVPSFDFQPTCHWVDFMLRARRVGTDDTATPADAVTLEALVHRISVSSGNASPVLRDALWLQLLVAESERLDLTVEQRALDDAAARLALRTDLDDDDQDQLASAAAIAAELIGRRLPELAPFVRLSLAERGELAAVVAEIARAEAPVTDIDLAPMLEAYRRSSGIHEATPEAYARRLGLASPRAFIDELVAWYSVQGC
jgi:hypothetical protein